VTEAQAVEAIMARWEQGWTALHPDDPTSPDYVPFTLENEAMASAPTWARVSIVHSTRVQVSMGPPGTRRFEVRGYIAVQLFGDVNKGRGELAELSDDVRKVYEGQLVTVGVGDNVYAYAGSTRELPTDGHWYMQLVTVPFMYYEQR
jgi:hypothetical protein